MNENIIKSIGLFNKLWVEGDDDKHLMHHLLECNKIEKELITIEPKGGRSEILRKLKVGIKGSEITALGVVVDADEDLNHCWQAFSSRLDDAGYVGIPTQPAIGGTIITQEGLPKVGIWIMPNNQLTGMVEHFVSTLIPLDDLLWPMAGDIVQKVIATKCNFKPTYQKKAEIHTWLAWQEEPGKPMGQAITKKYLDANAPDAQKLVGWIRQLFSLV